MTASLILRRRALGGIVAILMGASLAFTSNTSAHSISIVKARDNLRAYARRVMYDQGSPYVRAITSCEKAFSGHNHYARCMVQYKNKENRDKEGVFACTETMEVFFQPHNRGEDSIYYMRHTSRECGRVRWHGAKISIY